MPERKIKEFLDNQKVKYVSLTHSPAFTSQEVAASAHISGKQLAKTVVVKVAGKMALIVVPGNHQINFAKLRQELGSDEIDLAAESEFKDRFPGCEVGAMPPFGNLYDLPVYVCDILGEQKEIAFNAGSHSELIQLAFDDFVRLAKPKLIAC